MWKFKSWKGKDKCLFLLTIGVIFCILAFPAEGLSRKAASGEAGSGGTGGGADSGIPGDNSDANSVSANSAEAAEVSAAPAGTYEAMLEKRVKEILKHVDGVGTVDVMIVLKSSAEKVIHVDDSSSQSSTQEKDSSGGTRKIESQERENSAVLLSGDGQNAPIIEKELYPEISGIVISATGGGNPTVQAEISAAMEALFDLPAHKIKVLKRVE